MIIATPGICHRAVRSVCFNTVNLEGAEYILRQTKSTKEFLI